MVFRWRVDDGPLIVVLGFSNHQLKKRKTNEKKYGVKFGPLWQNFLDPRMRKRHITQIARTQSKTTSYPSLSLSRCLSFPLSLSLYGKLINPISDWCSVRNSFSLGLTTINDFHADGLPPCVHELIQKVRTVAFVFWWPTVWNFQMSRYMWFQQCGTMYVRPAKSQTSLCIRAVWLEPLLVAWIFYD